MKMLCMHVADQIPSWWSWGYWVSPLTYGFNAITVNEMFAPRWMDKLVIVIFFPFHLIDYSMYLDSEMSNTKVDLVTIQEMGIT